MYFIRYIVKNNAAENTLIAKSDVRSAVTNAVNYKSTI